MAQLTRSIIAVAVLGALTALATPVIAQEQTPAKPQQQRERIYGYQMMTDEERNAYREKMRNAKSAEERQAIRDEHHKAMQARAKERGVTLPDSPPPGKGPQGMGPGKGPRGGGMGMGPAGGGPDYGKGPGGGPGTGPGAAKN